MTDKKTYTVIQEPAKQNILKGASAAPGKLKLDSLPPVAVSWGRASVFKTGAWRNTTPYYVKRLPPCRKGCPAGNDIEGWLSAAAGENWSEAAQLLLDEQPLPSVCGRVCYHPCEDVCNRGSLDQAVSIRGVERFLGDLAYRKKMMPTRRSASGSRGKILVVGTGPAGLAASWLLARAGHDVDIIDRPAEAGGLLRYGIPAYRLPRNILDYDLIRLRMLGVNFFLNRQIEPDKGIETLKEGYDAVFLATGAANHRNSGIVSDFRNGVIPAIPFLQSISNGNTTDSGRKIAVIGGGNSAVDAARCAVRTGADVTILYRRTLAEMPAYSEEIEASIAEGVNIEYLVSPEFFRRNRNGLKMLRCYRNVLGKPDSSGRRRPEPVAGSEFEIEVDTVIDAVGEYPDPSALTRIEMEQKQLKLSNPWGRTELEEVWTGGDFSNNQKTVAHAIADGKRAAVDIDMYLNGDDTTAQQNLIISSDMNISASSFLNGNSGTGYGDTVPVHFDDLNTAYLPQIKRRRKTEMDPVSRSGTYSEILTGFSKSAVIHEATRCIKCGTCDSCGNCHVFCPDGAVNRDPQTLELSFDLDHCKGCGICFAECPRSAIEMKT